MKEETHMKVASESKRRGGAALAVGLALVAVGCGSKSDSGSDTASSSGSKTTSAAISPTIEELTTQGTETKPPTSGPPPAKGKSVWWLSCGLQVPDCALPASAGQEAAKKLGIDMRVANGNLNVGGGFVSAMKTAMAAKPDGIVLHGVDCNLLVAPLQEAKREGIKILLMETPPCKGNPGDLYEDMNYAPDIPNTDVYEQYWGKLGAEYIIAKTEGKAKVIDSQGTDSVFPNFDIGFREAMKKCSGCEIVDTVKFVAADQVPNGPWVQRFRTSLTKNPDANAVFIPSDGMSTAVGGNVAAFTANPKLVVVTGGSGTGPGMDAVRDGKQTAVGAAHDASWMAYAAMDTMNRLIQDKPVVTQGVGAGRSADKDHNVPDKPGTPYQSPVDWKSAYDKLWGVGL
jgi:ribose transport system substrate-binding protein